MHENGSKRRGYLSDFIPDRSLIDLDYFKLLGIDVEDLTPLKRKLLMESEDFAAQKMMIENKRNEARNLYGHITVKPAKSPIYDLNRGGFPLRLEWKKPFQLVIPSNMQSVVRIDQDDYNETNLLCKVYISNLEEASLMEDNQDYGYIVFFDYLPVESQGNSDAGMPGNKEIKKAVASERGRSVPGSSQRKNESNNVRLDDLAGLTFRVADIVIFKKSTEEIVWSALLGDQSEKLRTKIPENPGSDADSNNTKIYAQVDEPAAFPGGQGALFSWLTSNIRYPESAQQNGVSGRVIVKFVVERDGSISNVTIAKGVDRDLDQEAVRVVKRMPTWIPGKSNGQMVRTYFTLPIPFKLQN